MITPTVSISRRGSTSSMASVDSTNAAAATARKRQLNKVRINTSDSDVEMIEPKKTKHRTGRNAEEPTSKRITAESFLKDTSEDRTIQISAKRMSRNRALKQRLRVEMADQSTEDLRKVVEEETDRVTSLAHGASNLKGTNQKALYEAATKISVITDILRERVKETPGSVEMEELREELEALKKENLELREGLRAAREDIKRLRTRDTEADREVANKDATERRTTRTTRSNDLDRVNEVEVGDRDGRRRSLEESEVFPRPGPPPAELGTLEPVYRPPLRGVARRNLDDGSIGEIPNTQSRTAKSREVETIREVVTAVLKELGVVKNVPGKETGTAIEPGNKTKSTNDRGSNAVSKTRTGRVQDQKQRRQIGQFRPTEESARRVCSDLETRERQTSRDAPGSEESERDQPAPMEVCLEEAPLPSP